MQHPYTLEIVPPSIEVGVNERYGINVILDHKRMHLLPSAVLIKYILKERIDRRVQVEREARGPGNAKPAVQVEAARA